MEQLITDQISVITNSIALENSNFAVMTDQHNARVTNLNTQKTTLEAKLAALTPPQE